MAIYTQKTSKGQLMSASVAAIPFDRFKVAIRGIEPFHEADQIFNSEPAAVKHAQAMLDEYAWRLEERYELDAIRAAEMAAFEDVQPTDEPAAVDMGGDFDGFLEAVNAGQAEPAAQVWYTDPVTSADGEQIKARVTVRPELGDFLIEVLANGMALVNETETIYGGEGLAIAMANAMVFIYAHKLDKEIIEEPKPETRRIEQLRARIASQERELIDLRLELSQLLEGEV